MTDKCASSRWCLVNQVIGSCGSTKWCLVNQIVGRWHQQKVPCYGHGDSLMVKSVTLEREKVQQYFREIDSENIYAKNVKNEQIVNL